MSHVSPLEMTTGSQQATYGSGQVVLSLLDAWPFLCSPSLRPQGTVVRLLISHDSMHLADEKGRVKRHESGDTYEIFSLQVEVDGALEPLQPEVCQENK